MFCIIHKIPQEQLLGKNHSQITLNMHQPKKTARDPCNKNVRLLLKSLILQTLVTFASLNMISITDSQKLPSLPCHWHAETAVFQADRDCLIDSLYFPVSFYLPLASSSIQGARALKGKDHRDSFVLFLNNA